MQYSSSSRVLICIQEVDGASPSIAEARSVAQLVEQQHPLMRLMSLGKGPKRWVVKQAVGSNPTTSSTLISRMGMVCCAVLKKLTIADLSPDPIRQGVTRNLRPT
jgi:hypothetical protein